MKITLSTRHCEVSEALRERASAVAERLAQIPPHAIEVTIVFEFESGPDLYRNEIRLHTPGRRFLVGIGEGPDHRTALDRAEEKLRQQLAKAGRGRTRTRQMPAPGS